MKCIPGDYLMKLVERKPNVCKAVMKAKTMKNLKNKIQCLAKLFGPLELCDLLPHFRLQT